MGAGASIQTKIEPFEPLAHIYESTGFLFSDSHPIMVLRKNIKAGTHVMIDVDETGKRVKEEQPNFWDKPVFWYEPDLTLKFGTVRGVCASGLQKQALDFTVQVDEHECTVFRGRHLLPLRLPELEEVGIEIDSDNREVGVEIEWQGGKHFLGELVGRTDGKYDVRFLAGRQEVMAAVPIYQLKPVDKNTCRDASPDSLAPDPLWMLDRKIQAEIDAKWPIKRRIHEVLDIIRSQMRPPGAAPLGGNFVGDGKYDNEGYPAHPHPIPELRIDGAFMNTWGKYAGKVKFANTYKIGPAYPRMDAWVNTVDAGDPLYFHVALPVYAGLICLGMFKNPGEAGTGQPEWIRASDVALVGIALYADHVLLPGNFTEPQVEKTGFQKYGHDCCHFIPGCASTYFADASWIGGVFCLAPTETDYELCDDIYTITEYHQLLRDKARQASFGTPEVEIQVNLILSTNYLANVRQVCAGSVKVTLSDQGLAVAYERMKHIMEKRLGSDAARNPKRPRKALSEITYEEAVQMKLAEYPPMPGTAALPPMPKGEKAKERDPRAELEQKATSAEPARHSRRVPGPPAPPGGAPYPPDTPDVGKGVGLALPDLPAMGSQAQPIRGPEAGLPSTSASLSTTKTGASPWSKSGKVPAPPQRPQNATPSPPRTGLPPTPPPRPPAGPYAH